MEEYNNCPICFEVPEKEIYQCSAGHIICDVCSRNLTECPQCRVPYGATRVRCRVLEALLDTKEFECKFSNKGCDYECKRSELSNHASICNFNPDTVPLCKFLELNCAFRLGSCSREQVLLHFKDEHKLDDETLILSLTGSEWMPWFRKKSIKSENGHFGKYLKKLTNEDTSPLFLYTVTLNRPFGFLSITCTKIWEPKDKTREYKMEVNVQIGPSELPIQSVTKHLSVDPLGYKLKVSTLQEAECILKTGVIGISIGILEKIRFGERAGDEIVATITPI